jgi:DNA-binding MarR family transcriptional regulator
MTCQLFRYAGVVTEPRWLDEREQRAWRGYLAMQARLQARLNRRLQDDSGLSLTDFDVLVALTDADDVRMRVHELADTLQWERSRLSHQLSRMQRRGLLEREDCEDDARGAFVVLTGAGRRAIERAAPGHVEAVRELVFDGLDDDQVDALARIAEIVLERVGR